MIKILLALIITTQSVFAFNLNGKHWAEDTCTIAIPVSLEDPLILKRLNKIKKQFRSVVPFKVRGEVLDGAFASTLDAIYYAGDTASIVILYSPGEDQGIGNRVANTSFITSQAGTKVHGAVVRINDLRYQEVTAGGDLNYLANLIGHEIGHAFGLDHAEIGVKPHPIMSIGKFSKFKRLGLAPDDKKGLREIYKGENK